MADFALTDRVQGVLASLPDSVLLVGAAKTRTPDEVHIAVEAGLRAVGHNYVQEADAMRQALRERESRLARLPRWHLIGHLQRNKARKAAALFDMVETIDSVRIAETLDRHCASLGKAMPVLLEVNSGEESSKTGVLPEQVADLARQIAGFSHLAVQGLMTMGPRFGDPEDARPCFRLTRRLFDQLLAADLPDVDMQYLSMGMSNSYEVAIEEGANIVRIGTKLFGARNGG